MTFVDALQGYTVSCNLRYSAPGLPTGIMVNA